MGKNLQDNVSPLRGIQWNNEDSSDDEKYEQADRLSLHEQAEQDQITLATTFQSFKDLLSQQGWSVPELLFGIRWLHRGKQKRDFSNFVKKSLNIDQNFYKWLQYIEYHCRICNALDVKPRNIFLDLTGFHDNPNRVIYFAIFFDRSLHRNDVERNFS